MALRYEWPIAEKVAELLLTLLNEIVPLIKDVLTTIESRCYIGTNG